MKTKTITVHWRTCKSFYYSIWSV